MTVSEVFSEDPRFIEREPPPLSEEFPEGSKVFFLGEHAYGVAAQVSGTSDDTLSVILVVRTFPLAPPLAFLTNCAVLPIGEDGERQIQERGLESSTKQVLPILQGCRNARHLG